MTSVDADLRSGRRFESGRRSESIIYKLNPVKKRQKFDLKRND